MARDLGALLPQCGANRLRKVRDGSFLPCGLRGFLDILSRRCALLLCSHESASPKTVSIPHFIAFRCQVPAHATTDRLDPRTPMGPCSLEFTSGVTTRKQADTSAFIRGAANRSQGRWPTMIASLLGTPRRMNLPVRQADRPVRESVAPGNYVLVHGIEQCAVDIQQERPYVCGCRLSWRMPGFCGVRPGSASSGCASLLQHFRLWTSSACPNASFRTRVFDAISVSGYLSPLYKCRYGYGDADHHVQWKRAHR
jgi:hypothetical protein